jgi:hypothetical protein
MKNEIDAANSAVGKWRVIHPMPRTPSQADLPGSYDYRPSVLSAGIAMLASYAALDLGGRVSELPVVKSRISPPTATHLDDKSL